MDERLQRVVDAFRQSMAERRAAREDQERAMRRAMRREEKPPLGVMPRNLWLESRIRDVVWATYMQFSTFGSKPDTTQIRKYLHELDHLVGELDRWQKQVESWTGS